MKHMQGSDGGPVDGVGGVSRRASNARLCLGWILSAVWNRRDPWSVQHDGVSRAGWRQAEAGGRNST